MKAFFKKSLVLLLVGMFATSVFAAHHKTTSTSHKAKPAHSKTMKTKHKKKSHCKHKYINKCTKNKKGHRVCKKTKVCK